jgi:hypothetical protein
MKFLRVQDNIFNIYDIVEVSQSNNYVYFYIRTTDSRQNIKMINYKTQQLARTDFERIHNELLTLTATP